MVGLKQCAGQRAQRRAEAGAERGEESGARPAGIRADVKELRRDAEGAAEEVGVNAEEAGEALQGGHLALEGGVGEGQLILLGLIPFCDGFLAGEVVGEFAEAGGVVGGSDAVYGGLLERIEGAGDRSLGLAGDGSFVGGAEAGVVQDALELRVEQIAGLLLLIQELLVLGVDIGELLIGEIHRLCLGATHKTSGDMGVEEGEEVEEVEDRNPWAKVQLKLLLQI